MAGHSQFANIKHRKGAQDAKKAKLFSRLRREILVAARSNPDPDFNSRLRYAISCAKKENLPKDKIDAAIEEASSPSGGVNYEEIRYEGYGPCGVAFIITLLTDNRNRAASEMRNAFSKHGGTLGESGSVTFMFHHVGLISYENSVDYEKLFNESADRGALDLLEEDEKYSIVCDVSSFASLRDFLEEKFGHSIESGLFWRPLNIVTIDDPENCEKVRSFIDALEQLEDVQKIEGNFKFV